MQLKSSILVQPTGILSVGVTVTPDSRGYAGTTLFRFEVFWDPVSGSDCEASINYGDGNPLEYSFPIYPPTSFSHRYNTVGTFTATINVTDLSTYAEGSVTITIQTKEALTITFTSNVTTGKIPLAVTFSCNATKGWLNYTWTLDPGDGSTPYSGTRTAEGTWTQNHTYNKVGTFTATLTVTDALGAGVTTAIAVSTILEGIIAWWNARTTLEKIITATLAVSGTILAIKKLR